MLLRLKLRIAELKAWHDITSKRPDNKWRPNVNIASERPVWGDGGGNHFGIIW